MFVQVLGIIKDFNAGQFTKTRSPIFITLGIDTNVKEEQYSKALLPILVQVVGSSIFFKPFAQEKEYSLIPVNPSRSLAAIS